MCVGKEVTVTHQYAAVGLLAFPLFWIAGAGSAVFWVIGEIFLRVQFSLFFFFVICAFLF